MGNHKKRIAVAMSGGVDSSVAAKLLRDQGYEVVGIFLHFWKEQPSLKKGDRGDLNFENKCCSAEALADARRVAAKIGIPLHVLNFSKIFKKQVVDNFLTEYGRGRTPNPCVRCNKTVKLGYLINQAKKLGFDYAASGHYVNLKQKDKKFSLYKAKDKNKDQSYFLYTFNQKELKHLLFPLGNYTKLQVRRLAKKFKLPVAEKPESQEICFVPGKSHNEFLRRHLKLKPGPIVILERSASGARPPCKQSVAGAAIESRGFSEKNQDSISPPAQGRSPSRMTKNKIIGQHQGLPLYTVGQRKGIEIGGTGPYYAARMDYKTNILYVVNNSNDKILYNNKLIAKNVNWISGAEPKLPLKCQAVIRYRHKPVTCVVVKNKNLYQVKFKEPQRAITSGQSVVFYKNNLALGGGIIEY